MSDSANKKPDNEEQNKSSSHNVLVTFFCALLICCGLYGFVIYLHNDHIVEGQNRIIRTYSQQIKILETRNNPVNIRDSQREKELEAFHQEVKTLLDLEFNRIQNEFEAIEIWTGVLTVIFLIFSFYSLFKTEQLENQSKDELKRIKRINEEGISALSQFDKDSKTGLKSLENDVEKVKTASEKQIKDKFEKLQSSSINDFEKRAKNLLEDHNNKINALITQRMEEIKKQCDTFIKVLKSIAEKDIDLNDYAEEELDAEELRKDKEAEEKED